MKIVIRSLSSFAASAVSAILISSCASQPVRVISSLNENAAVETEIKSGASPRDSGCDDGRAVTLEQRKAVVIEAVRQAEAELAKNPARIREPEFRSRVATFAAATVDDKVPLISMDRACWAEFYDGQKKLADGDEAGAKENGDAWRVCLEAMFPERVAIARPYFSCFNPESSKAPEPPEL